MPRYVITQTSPLPKREWTFYDWQAADEQLRKLQEQDFELACLLYRTGNLVVRPIYKFEEFPDEEMVFAHAA